MVEIRQFPTGATRDTDAGKPDYEGYLSPQAIRRYGEYMLRHTVMPDGTRRASDNWQKGIPRDAYMKSAWRHFLDVWTMHRAGKGCTDEAQDALCALLFNVMGYLHEAMKENERAAQHPSVQSRGAVL
jgi:hypothetical protein